MTTTIQKWGNSHGIRLPKVLLDTVKWSENDKISIVVKEGKVIMEKEKMKRKNIKDLFENYDGEYKPTEFDWGKPEGDEIW